MKKVVMKKSILVLLLCFLGNQSIRAQMDYKDAALKIQDNINTYLFDAEHQLYYETTDSAENYNWHSWLWPLCALVQGTNEMDELFPGKHYMLPVEKALEEYYLADPPSPGWQDYVLKERKSSRFYDDNQWIAIAYMDAYKRTKNTYYLEISKEIYDFMMTGQDQVSGGGIYWKEGDFTSKNTCSNGPGILVALQLYAVTKEKKYLKTALDLYEWTNKYLRSPEGFYYDNLVLSTMTIDSAAYTYNTGTMLESNVLLYERLGDEKYLIEAQKIAKAGKDRFFKNGRLPGEYWFNAVMLRGYLALYKIDQNENWIQFFKEDAEGIWKNERDRNNLLGKKKGMRLIDQAAMMEIYARLAQLHSSPKATKE